MDPAMEPTLEEKEELNPRSDPITYKQCEDCGRRVNIKYAQRHKITQGCRETAAFIALNARQATATPAGTPPDGAQVAGTFLVYSPVGRFLQ
jgi:hypothetical protein